MLKNLKFISCLVCCIFMHKSTAFSQNLQLLANIIKDNTSKVEDNLTEQGILFSIKIGAYKYEVDKSLLTIQNNVGIDRYYQGRTRVEYTNNFRNLKWKHIEIIYLGQGSNARVETVTYYYDKLDYQSSILRLFSYYAQNHYVIETDCSQEVEIIDEKTKKVVESYKLSCNDFFDLEGSTKFTIVRDYPYSSGNAFGKISISYGGR